MVGAWSVGRNAGRNGVGVRAAVVLLLVCMCALSGCRRREDPPIPGLRVVVTVAPLAGLVGPLLPEGSDVRILMKPGRSEHGYEFTPEDLSAVGRADLIVYVGLGLEPQIERLVASKGGRVSGEAVGFASAVGISADGHDHAHDHDHEHGEDCDHGSVDPHLWLDPILCAQLVPALNEAVARASARRGIKTPLPGEDGARDLIARVMNVDDEYRAALAGLEGRSIVTHHAAFSRLAERYGLRIAAVIRPLEGVEPDARQTAAVIAAVRESGVPVIFVEPQFDHESARRIASAAGVGLGRLDPLGDGDWFALMRANLAELVVKLGGKG
ncbi:MAG: zinc ABC transporter substrate-binding protein [Phycisphaeraceae bacterium]|nr:MAG: zinc ABC transporter substrate-binding protein [Phycisphaeraceae bacterium]